MDASAAATAAKAWQRQVEANENPLTLRAFAAHAQHGRRTGIDNYLGVDDRQFLSKKPFNSRLPAAQASGEALFLHRAIEIGDCELVVAQLSDVAHAIDANTRNSHGETLLHTAVLHEQLSIVQALLAHGADPNAAVPSHTAISATLSDNVKISAAPRSENFRLSRMLTAEEATPVHYACAVGNVEILKLLLSPHARLPFQMAQHRRGSLLIWAITCSHCDVIELLVHKKQLETNCLDEDGNNAVGVAALVLAHPAKAAVLKRIIKVLIRADSIDINHSNLYGLSAWDVAEAPHVKQLLASLGGVTARKIDVDALFHWDRERSREEYTYRRDRQRAIMLRNRS